MYAHLLGKMLETASIKRKIISFHNGSTSLCGLRRKSLSEQTLLKIVNDLAQEERVEKNRRGEIRKPNPPLEKGDTGGF
jgi:hypothetical protein